MDSTLFVLVVEDDIDLREILEEVVAELGYKPLVASGGQEALDILKTRQVDIIVSDMNMPDMSGLELLKVIRDHGYKLPFIIQSGSSSREKFRELEAMGLFDFLLKPASFEIIQATLKRASASLIPP